MLNIKKSQSILQWFNSLTTKGDVNSLAQFADGSHFYEIVASLQPFCLAGNKEGNLSTESVIFSETSIACNEVVVTSVEEGAAEGKMETSLFESGNTDPFVIKESDHTDTHKKYDVIRKFIDDFYHVESSSLIDYKDCQNGKELELAKVAVFLLSAMVQNLLSSDDKVVFNTTLLDAEVQENIRECLTLVLMEKDMEEIQIKKELNRILSRPASFKGTPVRKQPSRSISDPNDISEGVKNVPKKRRERTSVIIYEDGQDSPLKNLLESPKIQYKAAIFKKESEVAKLRSALHNEENKVEDLTLEKSNLNKELEKRKKELEFYKKELESHRQAFSHKEEEEMRRTEELKNKKLEEERVRKLIEAQEEEIKQLRENNEALQEKVIDIEKKLEQDVTSSLIEESNNLKEKIQILELDNEKKCETIKTLNEKVVNLENDLKMYQQLYQDFSVPTSRRELRSPNVPETLSTIIYADEQSSREQELRQDPETKDERIKRLAHQQRKGDLLKNKSRNVESNQIVVDNLCGRVNSLETEKNRLTEKLKYYESRFGHKHEDALDTSDANSMKKGADRIRSVSDDVSEISASYRSKCNNKIGDQVCGNFDDSQHSVIEALFPSLEAFALGKLHFEKETLSAIIVQMEKKNCLKPNMAKKLKENCEKIRDSDEFSASLQHLLDGLVRSTPSVTTRRSRSLAAEEIEANSLVNKNKDLEQEIKILNQTIKSLQNKNNKKEDELKLANKNLEDCNADLLKEIQKLKEEVAVLQEKYINVKKLAKKKDEDVKKYLFMYQKAVQFKEENESKKQCGKECETLQMKVKELSKECHYFEKQIVELKMCNKNLVAQVENLRHDVHRLTEQKREIEHELKLEKSALSANISDRDAVVRHNFQISKHEPPKTAKNQQLRKKEEQKHSLQPMIQVNTYMQYAEREQSMSNSMLAGSSFRSGFFQAADEDDFLNESSIAEIHNGFIPEGESGESRLQEIRRRNTLCPPHLQSSYPLEIQDMTPNEKKYFDPEEVYFDMDRKTSLYQGKRDYRSKPKSKYMEDDSDDSDDSSSYPVKKRKVAETVCVSEPVSKNQSRPLAKIIGPPKEKPSTPLKRAVAFVKKQSTFKTPRSVHRLMSMPRKSKPH